MNTFCCRTFLSWHSDRVTVVSSSKKLRSLPWPNASPSSRTKLNQKQKKILILSYQSMALTLKCIQQCRNLVRCVHDVLRQRADWRFRLYDLLVGELLLQVPTSQAPQMVHLIYGTLWQVVFIIVYKHTHTKQLILPHRHMWCCNMSSWMVSLFENCLVIAMAMLFEQNYTFKDRWLGKTLFEI